MLFFTLGLNHETADIAVRERLSFGPEALAPTLHELKSSDQVSEVAILSTCNRTEFYCRSERLSPSSASHDKMIRQAFMPWLVSKSGCRVEQLERSIYTYPDASAVKHAFRVAAGLDSMVLGEPQILGQMKTAFHVANETGTTGTLLNRLFQKTFSVAKQIRHDTDIGANPVSVAYAGVQLAKRLFSHLEEKTVLLIGAGEMIELVAQHLKSNRVNHIIVANRSIDRAQTLAQSLKCQAITLAQIPEYLSQADIVVSSTASTLPILGKGAIEAALKKRLYRPMFLLDLAVPRDIEPEAGSLRNTYLYTVDDLVTVTEQNKARRMEASSAAENIIDLEVVRFMRWLRSLHAVPDILALQENFENVQEQALERALKQYRNGTDAETAMRELAQNLTNKYAHYPIQALRQAKIDGDAKVHETIRRHFKINK